MTTGNKTLQNILITQEEVNRLGARPKGSIIIQSQSYEEFARGLQAELNTELSQIKSDEEFAIRLQAELSQIKSDEEFARGLQAELNTELSQIKSDEEFAIRLQAEFDCEEVNAMSSQPATIRPTAPQL